MYSQAAGERPRGGQKEAKEVPEEAQEAQEEAQEDVQEAEEAQSTLLSSFVEFSRGNWHLLGGVRGQNV